MFWTSFSLHRCQNRWVVRHVHASYLLRMEFGFLDWSIGWQNWLDYCVKFLLIRTYFWLPLHWWFHFRFWTFRDLRRYFIFWTLGNLRLYFLIRTLDLFFFFFHLWDGLSCLSLFHRTWSTSDHRWETPLLDHLFESFLCVFILLTLHIPFHSFDDPVLQTGIRESNKSEIFLS